MVSKQEYSKEFGENAVRLVLSQDRTRAAIARELGIPSMSRKGDCWDNAPTESFFGSLKVELVHHEKFKTKEEARIKIFDYIKVFYNGQRLHSTLHYLSPKRI